MSGDIDILRSLDNALVLLNTMLERAKEETESPKLKHIIDETLYGEIVINEGRKDIVGGMSHRRQEKNCQEGTAAQVQASAPQH